MNIGKYGETTDPLSNCIGTWGDGLDRNQEKGDCNPF
jgi:hypothetical protein